MQFAGLDIGTTSCKAAIFDQGGALLGSAGREYSVDIPAPTWAEQDAERVWQLAQDALQEAVAIAAITDIAALGLSVQGESAIPVDVDGRALRPAILGMDTRTDEQNRWLRRNLGARYLFEHTGMPVHTVNTLPKLLWLKQNEPELWARVHRFLLYEDFLIQKMTGQPVISRCLASRTQLYDLAKDQWSPEILGKLDLQPERLSSVSPSGVGVGTMHPELSRSLGLTKPPLVVTGGHDQACGALGVGLVGHGLAMVSTGTAEVVEVALDTPVLSDTLYEGNISVYAHVVEDLYLSMTLNHSGGLLLRWFRDTLGESELKQAQAAGLDAYDLLLEGV